MKRIYFTFLLLFAAVLLLASTSFSYVNMKDYGDAVTRVVIGLSGDPLVKFSTSGDILELSIEDFTSQSQAQIEQQSGVMVATISQNGSTISIKARESFRFERFRLGDPQREVIDIFTANPTRTQRITIGDFYAGTGKLNSADNTFYALDSDYPQDPQILYHWALALKKRGSLRATEKLLQIPSGSGYYQPAQALLAKLHSAEEPLPAAPPEAISITPPMPAAPVTTPIESISIAPKTENIPPKPEPTEEPSILGYLPLLLVEGLFIGFFAYLISLLINKSKQRKPKIMPPEINEANLGLDSQTLIRMVSKLLADGWTVKEISKELKLKQSDVEQLSQHCRKENHDDNA